MTETGKSDLSASGGLRTKGQRRHFALHPVAVLIPRDGAEIGFQLLTQFRAFGIGRRA